MKRRNRRNRISSRSSGESAMVGQGSECFLAPAYSRADETRIFLMHAPYSRITMANRGFAQTGSGDSSKRGGFSAQGMPDGQRTDGWKRSGRYKMHQLDCETYATERPREAVVVSS